MSVTLASGPRKTSPSRLALPPSLRPAPSLSSLHIRNHSIEPLALPSAPPTAQSQALESSASSVFTVDLNEGILLQSDDTETEEAEENTVVNRDSDVDRVDEDSKRTLRDQLRRTLSRKASGTGGVFFLASSQMSYESTQILLPLAFMSKINSRTFLI
jgi:hypothetical protein